MEQGPALRDIDIGEQVEYRESPDRGRIGRYRNCLSRGTAECKISDIQTVDPRWECEGGHR